jgi:hypothetical protein
MAGRRRGGPVAMMLGAVVGAALLAQPASGAPAPGSKKGQGSTLSTPILRTAAQSHTAGLGQVVRTRSDGRVQLAFHAKSPTGAAEQASLTALGAAGVRSMARKAGLNLPSAGTVEAWVPRDKVEAASKLPWVVSVGSPAYASFSPHGLLTKNSVGLGAEALQAKGITGKGVKVGVVSDGVSSLLLDQLLGELPAVTVVDQATVGAGTGDEGTAMLEIVHDMAPDAQLFFHAAGLPPAQPGMPPDATQVTLVNAFLALADAGVDIIVHDVGFLDEPLFQQGIVAAVSDALGQAGISVHSAAGNDALTHAARVPAVGTGRGPDNKVGPFANCDLDDLNVVAIAPNGDTTFDIILEPGVDEVFALQWSEPRAVYPTAGRGGFTDLDLYLMDEGLTQCYAVSDLEQIDGTGDTFEGFFGVSPFAVPTRAKLVVNVFDTSSAVAPPVLDLRWGGATAVDQPTAAGSVDGVNNFTSGLAAASGAAFNNGLEPFSSQGPIELRTTTDCPPGTVKGPLDPCLGVAGPPARTFASPAWVTPDRVPVSGIGGFPTVFTGTSASAPSAAGCDALIRQAIGAPASPVGPIFARLAASAVDLAPAGPDNASGAGILSCPAAASNVALRLQNEPQTALVVVGGTRDVVLDVFNAGPDAALATRLVDALPPGARFLSSPNGCVPSAGAGGTQLVQCPLAPSAPAGSTQRVGFTVQVQPGVAPGTNLTLTATLASVFDVTPGDNVATLQITVTAPLASTGGRAGQYPLGLVLLAGGALGSAVLRRTRTVR